ncbi:MAG: hypothetical protein Q9162_007197 [Coniocarpon cinnabarinum]
MDSLEGQDNTFIHPHNAGGQGFYGSDLRNSVFCFSSDHVPTPFPVTKPRDYNAKRSRTSDVEEEVAKERKRQLLESLRFEQIDARWWNIRKAYAKTCRWLLQQPEYLEWRNLNRIPEHHGFLWIKGKPGAGKSTLMKFAFNDALKTRGSETVISFFFNARGGEMEKSTLGMYQSLLLQLLGKVPKLQDIFHTLDPMTWSLERSQWSIELLKTLLDQAIRSPVRPSVVCFIDALDECNEAQIRDMVSFFDNLGESAMAAGNPFQVCFSSRHYPHITIRSGLSLTLEGQEGHAQDIASYLENELSIGCSEQAERVRQDLRDKAAGVFMWIVLVVDILNKEYDSGRMHALQKKVREVPANLDELFRDILTRDQHNRDTLLLCIQWVLFARQPLRPQQLYYAILSGVELEEVTEWDSDQITQNDIKRFILDSSKGLAEISYSKSPVVQFIHESVRDFLLKENALNGIWVTLGSNFQAESHERLKQCCISYINVGSVTSLTSIDSMPKASTQEALDLRESTNKRFPFLEYSVKNVLFHADVAAEGGVSQVDFLQSFQLCDWINLDNLFERHEVRRHTSKASLLYVLAEHNMGKLIASCPSNLACFEVEDVRYGAPIFAALATQSYAAVHELLKVYVEGHHLAQPFRNLCEQQHRRTNRLTRFARNFNFSRRRTILSYLAENGDDVIVDIFLASQNPDPNSKDQSGQTPLWRAAANGRTDVVRLLLEKGADVESKDSSGWTPLWSAAASGRTDAIRLLLEKGADVESKDRSGWTPLWRAAENGHTDAIRLLLEKGADVEPKDGSGQTPLLWATANGHERTVKLLLEKGANIELKNSPNQTPLLWAAANGQTAAARLLLEKHAKIEARNSCGQTPLSWAAANGRSAVAQLLLEKDAKIESKDSFSQTPLLWAAANGHTGVVRLLLEKGAEIESKDSSDRTPLLWATANGHDRVVKLLLEKGAKMESKDRYGQTLLSWAHANRHTSVAQLLLEKGAEIESRDSSS